MGCGAGYGYADEGAWLRVTATHPRLTIELTPAERVELERIRARLGLRSLNAAVRALIAQARKS